MNVSERYVYIKNGDVVAQLQRIAASGDNKITSGPDAFIYDFLSKIGDIPVFVASRSSRNAIYENNNITACTYKANGNIVVKLFRIVLATTELSIRLLFYKPSKIICGTTGGFLWASYFVSSFYSIPIIYSCHNRIINHHNGLLKRYAMKIDNWCVRRCNNVICHGPFLRDQLIAIGVSPSKIFEFDVGFYDLYQSSNISESYRIPGIAENHRIILYVGRIEKEKGVCDLLEACAGAFSMISDVHIVYIGRGSALEKLQKEVERLKLSDKVHFLGYINHEKIVDVMRRSAILVTPTRVEFPEGRCMSAMEGLVLGLPVVSPDFGPFPYLIQHDYNGLLYEPNSITDLREKIIILIKDAKQYDRLKIGARITGNKLMNPEMSFGEAICYAFSH